MWILAYGSYSSFWRLWRARPNKKSIQESDSVQIQAEKIGVIENK